MPHQRHTTIQQVADSLQSLPHVFPLQALDEQHIQSNPWPTCHGSVDCTWKQQQKLCTSRLLLQQLDGMGWDKITDVSSDLTSITLSLRDAAGRQHQASIQVPAGFPVAAPSVSIKLPVATWKPKWVPGNTLSHLITQLNQVLGSFQAIWEQLEDIDQHTLLLDSAQVLAHPYSRLQRCIALGNSCSCQLQLSSACPTALPQVVQLPAPRPGSMKGCAAIIAASSRAGPAATACGDYTAPCGGDAEADLLAADDDCDDEDMADEIGACAICYALHLPNVLQPTELGELPSSTCSGRACGRVFHAACLAEWLGSLPDSRRVFDTLFGSCPFCHADISVSLRSISI
eukprot:gene8989-biopygen10842